MAAPGDERAKDVTVGGAPGGEKPAYPIGSVDTALKLLAMIAEREQVRISEASQELNVARSTAHRVVQMLQYHGLVAQDPTSKVYTVGPGLLQIGLQAVRGLDIRTLAHPRLQQLSDEVDETTHLFSLRGTDVVCLDSVESKRPLRVGERVGESLPAYATASGRALLAELPVAQLRRLYPAASLPRLQSGTVDSRAELERELERTRKLGYAVQERQTESDVSAIAAAVEDSRGPANFAITVSAPSSRFKVEDADRLGRLVKEAAADVAKSLPW
jgi:IclR family transcriptional regulator, acetate operon repressor